MDADPINERASSSGLSRFSPAQPLLLLTDFPPDQQGGGAVILRSLLTPADRARIVWATLSPLPAGADDSVVSLAPGSHRSLLHDGSIGTRTLGRRIRAIIETRGVTAVWVVAHGASVRLAPGLVATGLPVHITVHDDPAWAYAILTRRYVALAPLLARDFGRALKGAQSIDVVSDSMARRYRKRYGVKSSVVHRGLTGPVPPSPAFDRSSGLSVAVLGSTYGLREVRVLAKALAIVSDRLRLRTRLTVIGSVDESRLKSACPACVDLEVTGHLDEAHGVARLRDSFLLYMSYPFGRRGRVLRTTSFPTKLSTYILAARPLLLHMPSESSVASLDTSAHYATLWDSALPNDGADAIEQLWRDDTSAESFHAEADQLRQRYFDLSYNRAVLLDALNALPGTLA